MSESEEDSTTSARQKSIFSSMGRVKQINHLREKWSPKLKSPVSDRTFDTPPSSPWGRRPSSSKLPLGPFSHSPRPSGRSSRSNSTSESPRRQPVVTVVDMERYLAINSWLEHHSINVAQVETSAAENSKDYGLFDDMYCSLDVLETNLKTELSLLGINNACKEERGGNEASSSALFDYLTVIGVDMLDVKTHHFWNQRENVFEATVAFAHPPESQFNVESLEHFCFPTGIKTTSVMRNEPSGENKYYEEGEFFVLMISGGGIQGQNVQYVMCMKGAITIRGGDDDGKDLEVPICYCIIAQVPFIPFFRAVLQGFLDSLQNEFESSTDNGCSSLNSIVTDKVRYFFAEGFTQFTDNLLQHAGFIDDTIRQLKTIPLPDKGQSLSVNVFPDIELALTRPHKENVQDEKVVLLLQWALPSLLSRLSIDRLLQILSLLLLETKIIVVSDEIPLLSSATLGLASLLHPLVWAGPLISVLPPSMHEYMEAPVPLICGVDELPRNFECSKGTCIIHLMENRVQLHAEDEHTFSRLEMPELTSLSCDLTRFTKQMLGRVTGSFRDNVTPLSTHLVIHRIRRHIEHLITVCAHASENYRGQLVDCELNASEMRFIDVFMQTQMYQKYQDDQPIATSTESSNQQLLPTPQIASDEVPSQVSPVNTQHDGLKSAASVLFQIALAGVSTLPPSTSRTTIMPQNEEVEAPSINMELQMEDLETESLNISPTASSPSGRIFSNMKPSPTARVESFELLSPTPSEASTHTERRPDRTFVWPLSHSDLDLFWVADEASVASPGSSFESPRRSPNNESDFTYVEELKSVGRSEHGGVVNAQRADTEMTISIFDTALNEALGSVNADESWVCETSADPRRDDRDEERSTNRESTVEDEIAITKEAEQNNSPKAHHSWPDHQNEVYTEAEGARDSVLTTDQVKMLTTGISMESRGAWEGWCEGKMRFTPALTTLTWERRAVAFAALNMNITDITSVAFEDRRSDSFAGPKKRRVQVNFSSESIYFQFSSSPQHDEFFDALKQVIQPALEHSPDRQRSFSSLSSPGSPMIRTEVAESYGGTKTDITRVSSFLESDLTVFKRKLMRGFQVEKHGRLGKPHVKLLFTDPLCSHLLWRKPEDQQTEDQVHRRSNLFSHDKSIPVDSITAIVTGKQTTVFRRSTATKSNERLCLSILTPTRTLDICAHSLQGFQELYRGFSLLLEEINRTRDGID
ncbi:Suppression of tumorigenicity 5 protein [Phytophthora citrophthora]|uniref:Suppression of tumorigenicity 5 protein n=1 Tax=Phytophthora citrophthora TaxID=4793 RepID=A0AAD9LMN0_9STRA|nr:Suppression of tumorigenicity 5 protein [Phytophthora citrophthora]